MKQIISRFDWKSTTIIFIAVILSLAIYLLWSNQTAGPGFPLDDAWIHQTYARNLGSLNEWSFIPGKPSAGSTSPMWTVVLSIAYKFGMDPFLWVYFLGMVGLFTVCMIGESLFRIATDRSTKSFPWVGVFLAFEYHLVWSAGSGMEILLYSIVILAVIRFLFLIDRNQNHNLIKIFGYGFFVGMSIWIRPDAITLIGPFLLILFQVFRHRKFIVSFAFSMGGFLIASVPYLLFNQFLAGTVFPNTFFAKQAEYASYQSIPYITRLISEGIQPLIGPGLVLLPGFIAAVYVSIKNRNWPLMAAVMWWVGFNAIYAWRLPVTYQYGRYVVPAMPIFFVIGFIGTIWLARAVQSFAKWDKLIRFSSKILTVSLLIFFYFLGAVNYSRDVGIIQTEMVAAAKWIDQNTPQNSLIAAHDIGAIGYFSHRKLIDLAGLVSPEIIPFIRDETRLAAFLDQQNINYLVTFPGWYPVLIKHGLPIYQTMGKYSLEAGGENMVVFQWTK